MKTAIVTISLILLATTVSAQQAATQTQPSVAEVVAACNIQMGQSMTGLGQAQQEILQLQAQLKEAHDKLAGQAKK